MFEGRQDGAYLTPFVCPALDAFPECIDSLCYQLLHLRIGNTWLGAIFSIVVELELQRTHHGDI